MNHAAPLPSQLTPMLATLTDDRFSDDTWIFERKFDGERCLARRDVDGTVRMWTRNGKELTRTYPEVAAAIATQAHGALWLDGEVVAFAGRRTSFERLQARIGLTDPAGIAASGVEVVYYVFDAPFADGRDLRGSPLLERKRALRSAVDFGGALRYSQHRVGAGEEQYRRACARGDEGVMAKRSSSPYTAGRSKDWLKFKCVRDQEFVVGGWTDPKGSRAEFGALLVGYHARDGLHYAGKVGTGFDARSLHTLGTTMRGSARDTSPFDVGRVGERDVHWCEPSLVVQIGFTEWTRDGALRHPRFQGVRDDKNAADVVRESR